MIETRQEYQRRVSKESGKSDFSFPTILKHSHGCCHECRRWYEIHKGYVKDSTAFICPECK